MLVTDSDLQFTLTLNKLRDIASFFKTKLQNQIDLPCLKMLPSSSILSSNENSIGNFFKIDINNDNINSNDLGCKICNLMVSASLMVCHIDRHVLKNDVTNHELLCGFCGTLCGNQVTIATIKNRKNNTPFAQSSCLYNTKKFYINNLKRSSSRNPCTNRLVVCTFCKNNNVFWLNNTLDTNKRT